MMKWDELITSFRLGCPKESVETDMARIGFQRDFDRLVFSPVFRRLQGKTQVFPFPFEVITVIDR